MKVNREPIEIIYRQGREQKSVMAIGSPSSSYGSSGSYHWLTLPDGSELQINDRSLTKKMRQRISELHGRRYLYEVADEPEIVLTPWDENRHDGIRDYEVDGLPDDTVQLWSVNVWREAAIKGGKRWLDSLDNEKVWLIQTEKSVILHTMNNDEIIVAGDTFEAALAKMFCGQKLTVRTYTTVVTKHDKVIVTE